MWKLGNCACCYASLSIVRLPLLLFLQVLLQFPADYFILLRLIALNKVLRCSAPSYRKEKNELRVSSEQCQFSPSKLIWLSGDHCMKQLSLNIFHSVRWYLCRRQSGRSEMLSSLATSCSHSSVV